MVILRSQNKITDFLMILAWASPFNDNYRSLEPVKCVDEPELQVGENLNFKICGLKGQAQAQIIKNR